MSSMDKIPVYLRKPVFEKLFGAAEYSKLTREEKQMYDSSLKYKWDNENVMDYSVKEAHRAGQEEERAKALKEKMESADQMKKDGIPISKIAEFLKLNIEEIDKL